MFKYVQHKTRFTYHMTDEASKKAGLTICGKLLQFYNDVENDKGFVPSIVCYNCGNKAARMQRIRTVMNK